MTHVFRRSASYYTPTFGVVDFAIGQRLGQLASGSWATPCGSKVIHDQEVVLTFLANGTLVESAALVAPTVAVAPAPEPAPQPEPEVPATVEREIPDLADATDGELADGADSEAAEGADKQPVRRGGRGRTRS